MAPSQLVVFDFDWSMIDQDSDRWVFEVLAPDLRRKMEDPGTMQWVDLVAECLDELSREERGVHRHDIENALRQIPFHPAMKRGIQLLKYPASVDTTLFILSSANAFFIDTILQHQGLQAHFETIITNPADFSDPNNPNRLVLRPLIGPQDPPHGCPLGCEANMCKGQELARHLDTRRRSGNAEFDRIVYIGDGHNDFCAVLRLGGKDVVLCRRFRGLERSIIKEIEQGDASRLKCAVEYWSGAWEVEEKCKLYAKRTSFGSVD